MTHDTAETRHHSEIPNWVPDGAQRYLRHTENGLTIREIARQDGLHASTVLRQIRRIETRRDDPLVDAALRKLGAETEVETNKRSSAEGDEQPSEAILKDEARRILRRLCETGAVLAVAAHLNKAVVVRDGAGDTSTRTAVVDAQIAEAMALKGWIKAGADARVLKYKITPLGRSTLSHLLAEEESRRSNHVLQLVSDADAPVGSSEDRRRLGRIATVESPLIGLARRKDRDGSFFLSHDLVSSGERLREDFELAQVGVEAPIDWESFLSASVVEASASSVDLQALNASGQRVVNALQDLGPGLADVVLRCCCYLEGLEQTEKDMGWAARSGKVVLRIALLRLKRHYASLGDTSQMIG